MKKVLLQSKFSLFKFTFTGNGMPILCLETYWCRKVLEDKTILNSSYISLHLYGRKRSEKDSLGVFVRVDLTRQFWWGSTSSMFMEFKKKLLNSSLVLVICSTIHVNRIFFSLFLFQSYNLVYDPLGITHIDDVSPADMGYVRSVALLELTSILDNHSILYTRRRSKRKHKGMHSR